MNVPGVSFLMWADIAISNRIIGVSLIASLMIFAMRVLLADLRGVVQDAFVLIDDILRWTIHFKRRFSETSKLSLPETPPTMASE